MKRKRMFINYFLILIIEVFMMLFFSPPGAWAASGVIKAPATDAYIVLPGQGEEKDYDPYNPFDRFSVKVEGWACVEDQGKTFSDWAVDRVKEINLLLQPLAYARKSLSTVEMMLKETGLNIVLSRKDIENIIDKVVAESLARAGFSSEKLLIDRATTLSASALEETKGGIRTVFGFTGQDLFNNTYAGQPRKEGVWKFYGINEEVPSISYMAQNCYQESDLKMVINIVADAALKLEGAVKEYKEAREKALATAPPK